MKKKIHISIKCKKGVWDSVWDESKVFLDVSIFNFKLERIHQLFVQWGM